MTDDGMAVYGRPYQEFATRKKMFRRRKALKGHDIEVELEGRLITVSRKDKGIFCRTEGTWKRWSEVSFEYELVNMMFVRRTVCSCGDQLKETVL